MLDEALIDLTESCPLRCIHCSNIDRRQTGSILSWHTLSFILDSLKALKLKRLCLSGGEPLTYPELFPVISKATELGFETSLYTSGVTAVTNRSLSYITRRMAEELAGTGLGRAYISLYSANPETHDAIVGRTGAFSLVGKSAKNLIQEGIPVYAHFVPMKPNYLDLETTFKLSADRHFRGFRVLRLTAQGNVKRNQAAIGLNGEEISRLLERFSALVADSDDKIELTVSGFPNFRSCRPTSINGDHGRCGAGSTYVCIASNGDVYPCPALKTNPNFLMGNVSISRLDDILIEWKGKSSQGEVNKLPFTCPAHE